MLLKSNLFFRNNFNDFFMSSLTVKACWALTPYGVKIEIKFVNQHNDVLPQFTISVVFSQQLHNTQTVL